MKATPRAGVRGKFVKNLHERVRRAPAKARASHAAMGNAVGQSA